MFINEIRQRYQSSVLLLLLILCILRPLLFLPFPNSLRALFPLSTPPTALCFGTVHCFVGTLRELRTIATSFLLSNFLTLSLAHVCLCMRMHGVPLSATLLGRLLAAFSRPRYIDTFSRRHSLDTIYRSFTHDRVASWPFG